MDLISNIFNATAFEHDRFFNESFQLPYNFDAIKVQANELSTYRSVNQSFEKLYQNFLYIYGLTELANNVVPDNLVNTAGTVSASNALSATFTWTSSGVNYNSFLPFSSAGLSALDNAIILDAEYSHSLQQNIIVACSLTQVILIKTQRDSSSISVLLSSVKVNVDNNLLFQSINSVAIYDDNLYISDSSHNSVYKYDLTTLLTDIIYPNSLILTRAIGGTGDAEKKYEFNNVGGITVFNNRLYVLDRDNYSIKVYDTDLNFIKAVQRVDVFLGNRAQVIAGDYTTNNFYVATEDNNVVVFDKDFNTYTTVNFSSFLQSGETIKNIFSSKNFTNTYYIVTNYNIWKFYASKPNNPIGKYTLYRFGVPTTEVYCDAASVESSISGKDNVYILSKNGTTGIRKFINILDSINLISVLSVPDFDVYTLSDIQLQSSEYTQTWTINKAIAKLALNHMRLKDKMIGRFSGTFDSNNTLLLNGYLYFLLKDLDLTGYSLTLDHFAGNNEAFLNSVINRGLQKIYNLQLSMIAKSNTIIQDSSFSQNQTVFIG